MWSDTDKVRFIERLFGSGSIGRDGEDISVRCPICAPADHKKKKLCIRIKDDLTHCWVCGYSSRTMTPLIRKFFGNELVSEYVRTFNIQSNGTDDTFEEAQKLELPKDFRLIATHTPKDLDAITAKAYLRSRGLSDLDLWRFKFGLSNEPTWMGRVIMPSFSAKGELNYYTGRSFGFTKGPKYENPKANRLEVIFNEININWSEPVVLCEGPFDIPSCGDNATCLLGSELSTSSALFTKIIEAKCKVVLALDSDVRTTKVPKIAKRLTEYDVQVSIVELNGAKDPGDLSREQMKSFINDAKPYDWLSELSGRMSNVANVGKIF